MSRRHKDDGATDSASKTKTRFAFLLRELETEFDMLFAENSQLRERIALLEHNRSTSKANQDEAGLPDIGRSVTIGAMDSTIPGATMRNFPVEEVETSEKNALKSFTKNKAIKTRHKLKAHTSKIVSSFKAPSYTCQLVTQFEVKEQDY